ncbi:hypothetical protein [Nocardioides piscis]|uniref:Uncharacterized protein n=1 Tax=Nocardioides piscis TaxID=2714938 RepID=A0A6G7YG68_9ACTN|nr:hypothetical protein [Nocardioides piscis]QIK75812.1 hypothetical protein G7071_10525 [Nocardioides piscis]
MRFTEHELTRAVEAAARTVARAKARKRAGGADAAWEALTRIERYYLLDGVGSQVLPVLIALPDVEVAPGTRPTFTDAQIVAAVESTLADGGGRLRRKVTVAARVALVRAALAELPPRMDPDALTTSD